MMSGNYSSCFAPQHHRLPSFNFNLPQFVGNIAIKCINQLSDPSNKANINYVD